MALGDEDHRGALLAQLRYLLLEIEALGPLLRDLPAWMLSEAPAGERSMLASFARLAALDREVYLRQLRAVVAGEPVPVEENEVRGLVHPDLDRALADVHEAREALVAAFEAVPAAGWGRAAPLPDGATGDLYDLALHIVHRDAELLRGLAYRLHESPPPRDQDGPSVEQRGRA